jgi:hypothetical protein
VIILVDPRNELLRERDYELCDQIACKALERVGWTPALALDDAHSLTLVLCGASSAVDQAFDQQDWVVEYRVE